MTDTVVLRGPFLTRAQAARLACVHSRSLPLRPDLLSVGGTWLEEVYFEFQFDSTGIIHNVSAVVRDLKQTSDDEDIASWLVASHASLNGVSPLTFLRAGGTESAVLEAARRDGPKPRPKPKLGIVEPAITPQPKRVPYRQVGQVRPILHT